MVARQFLDGERVRLAAIREDDIATLISWDDNQAFMRLMTSSPAYPRSELEQREWWQARLKSKDDFHLAIRLKADNQLIGTLSITQIEWNHQSAWISIGIGDAEARGRGYGGEAMRLALVFAFDELSLHRLSLSVFGYNTAAIRMYERLGWTREGNFREYLQRDGQRFDMILYGMLAPEWRERQQPRSEIELV